VTAGSVDHARAAVQTPEHGVALDRFLAGVERRALRMAEIATGNRDDALDIVQEAMLKLAQRYAGHPPTDWPPLFYRILQSRISDWCRRRSAMGRWRVWPRRREDAPDLTETTQDPTAAEGGSQLAAERLCVALEEALAKLPLRQQQAFLLRVWEGFDVRATARVMRCSPGSVKTHYARAVHTLRATLGEHWP
jgi:RNA polymerase sigma-70 factor (ECF subfamily)